MLKSRKHNPDLTPLAKALRKNMTPEEQGHVRALWTIVDALNSYIDVLATFAVHAQDPHGLSEIQDNIQKAVFQLKDTEYMLQKAFGFSQDADKHTHWLKAKMCRCPKLDNTDPAFFGSGKIINGDCPIHGTYISDKIKTLQFEKKLETDDFRPMELELMSPADGSTMSIDCWYSEARIDDVTIPTGWSKASLRHSDDDDCCPATVEKSVGVNRFGDIVYFGKELPYPKSDPYFRITDWGFLNE